MLSLALVSQLQLILSRLPLEAKFSSSSSFKLIFTPTGVLEAGFSSGGSARISIVRNNRNGLFCFIECLCVYLIILFVGYIIFNL